MKYLNIRDDCINYKSSKWILEELLTQGCDGFSYEEFDCLCVQSIPYKRKLRLAVSAWSMGEKYVEKYFYIQGEDHWHKLSEVFSFNRNTIPVILEFMGDNLLDWDTHINKGVANWHFYKGTSLVAGSSVDDDFITINTPTKMLIEKLQQIGIPYEVANT